MLKLSIFVTLLISPSFTHGQIRSDWDKLNLSKTQLQAVYEKHFLFLTNKITGKQKLIKEESNAFIRLMNDTNKKDIGLNAFLNGSVIVSFYEPTLVNNEIKLNTFVYLFNHSDVDHNRKVHEKHQLFSQPLTEKYFSKDNYNYIISEPFDEDSAEYEIHHFRRVFQELKNRGCNIDVEHEIAKAHNDNMRLYNFRSLLKKK